MQRGSGDTGYYEARRAAPLAGVPLRTLYHWASVGIWVPTYDNKPFMRWSYGDLLALRLIDWLRKDKPDVEIPPTPMRGIRNLLTSVGDIGERLRSQGVMVSVDIAGQVVVQVAGEDVAFEPQARGFGQTLAGVRPINLVDPFDSRSGLKGPHLVEPRPTLRIIPGVVSGEPHVKSTRIATTIIRTLSQTGFVESQIRELYPPLDEQSIRDAIDLEVQLEYNLAPAA